MRYSILLLFFLLPYLSFSQEERERNWEINGYLKNLQTWLFFNDFPEDQFLQDNLIHNRLNFSWYLNEQFTFRADLRTRAFFGDLVRADPDYGNRVADANNDYFDLSVLLLNKKSWVIQSMLDRLYLEYSAGDWEIRLGRQRVNWGISTVWNPNDIFNAFAFTDFDYEERPGSDALRIRYFTGFASSLEVVVKAADQLDETVIAGMWKFNTGNYDFQLLSGYMMDDIALGGGWAGNIKNAGFKGEWTFFFPLQEAKKTSFAATLAFDYVFEKGLYFNLGYLFNSQGTSNGQSITNLFSFELSAKNLYPYRHALFVQSSYPVTPLLSAGVAIIYSPVDLHPLFANPTLSLSVAANWDLDLVGQLVFNEAEGKGYSSPIQATFLRLKYSF